MQFERQKVPEVVLITPNIFSDARGFFSETFRDEIFRSQVADFTFVQDNHSRSEAIGTIRGLHYQLEPMAQGKLIRATRGTILDVAVDIRSGSPTFGQYVEAILSAANVQQLWIPPGFAHGFITLEPQTEVQYKVTSYYSADHDRGIAYDDPDIGIDWRFDLNKVTLSAKDSKHPRLRDLEPQFIYANQAAGITS